MQEIINKKYLYEKESIDAIITNNTMIPGIKGKIIDIDKTYSKMKKISSFKESLITYKDTFPNKSIKNKYDKIIISGNIKVNNISIIINSNEKEVLLNINQILINNNTSANIINNRLINLNNTNYINTLSNDYNKDSHYCLTYNLNINKECIEKEKYTILSTNISSYHLTKTKEIIQNGKIITYTFNKNNYNDLIIIIKFLRNNNYNIVSIDELIKE